MKPLKLMNLMDGDLVRIVKPDGLKDGVSCLCSVTGERNCWLKSMDYLDGTDHVLDDFSFNRGGWIIDGYQFLEDWLEKVTAGEVVKDPVKDSKKAYEHAMGVVK